MDANFVIDNFLPVALGVAAPVAFYVNNGIFVGVPEDVGHRVYVYSTTPSLIGTIDRF